MTRYSLMIIGLLATGWLSLLWAATGDVTVATSGAFTNISAARGGRFKANKAKDTATFEGYSGISVTADTIGRKVRIRSNGGGSVSSVFGRAGVVAAQSGDYAAAQISYTNPTYTTVGAALDQLLYVAPGSPSVTGGGTYETGQTVASVALNWTITLGSKALTSQSIDNGIGSISTALRTYTHSGQTITADRTYTVSITDGTTPRTGSTTVAFYRKRHWGATATPLASIGSAAILALGAPTNEFATDHAKTITYDCTGGRYPTYAFPASFGALSNVTVGGLGFTDYTCSTVSHTNASGSITNYYVCQFNYLQTGSNITVVWN